MFYSSTSVIYFVSLKRNNVTTIEKKSNNEKFNYNFEKVCLFAIGFEIITYNFDDFLFNSFSHQEKRKKGDSMNQMLYTSVVKVFGIIMLQLYKCQ